MDLANTFIDISPVPQDDGPFPICAIQYPERFTQVMGFFRACLLTEELSDRTLALTSEVIDTNPANYTAWHFRRKCLTALGKPLAAEIEFTSETGGENPKNYQIWFHRRACLEQLGGTEKDAREELEYVSLVIADDSKNYHAWAHRQYIIQTFSLWSTEVAFVKKAISADIRNNSAWNQLWFATHGDHPDASGAFDIEATLDYALEIAGSDVYNESPFLFILGLLKEQWKKGSLVGTDKVQAAMEAVKDKKSAHVHSMLVDIAVQKKENSTAVALCNELITDVDMVRLKFWAWKLSTITQ